MNMDVTYSSREICAFKGATVDIQCVYSHHRFFTLIKSLWIVDSPSSKKVDLSQHPQYTGRVESSCEGNYCTLTIFEMRESDAGTYMFKFTVIQASTGIGKSFTGVPGVSLFVSGNAQTPLSPKQSCQLQFRTNPQVSSVYGPLHYPEVKVIRTTFLRYYAEAEFKCVSACPAMNVSNCVWYKNGQRVLGKSLCSYTAWFHPEDDVSCAIQGLEHSRARSVYPPRLDGVLVSPPGDIVEGTAVTLNCRSDAHPAASLSWYKRTTYLNHNESQLVFTSIQSSDSADYYCSVQNQLGNTTSEPVLVDVQYAPRSSSLSVSPSDVVEEGQLVTLTCSSDANPAASYTWYKNHKILTQNGQEHYSFFHISPEDAGIFCCEAENKFGRVNSSSVFIDVQYVPKHLSVSMVPPNDIVAGSSLALICRSDASPAASYTWYKEDMLSPLASGQTLTIIDIRSEQSGNYSCEAHNSRGRHNITVQVSVNGDSQTRRNNIIRLSVAVLFVSLLLVLTLHLRTSRRKTKSPSSTAEPNELVQPAELDEGDYENIRTTELADWWGICTPTEICALEGTTVELQCSFTYPPTQDGRETRVEKRVWFINGPNHHPEDLMLDPEYFGRLQSDCHGDRCNLTISDLRQSAVYKFKFTTNHPIKGSYTILPGVNVTVTDLRVQVFRGHYWKDMKCLSRCSAWPASSYIWYRNGEEIQNANSQEYSEDYYRYSEDSYSCAVRGHEHAASPPVCAYSLCHQVVYDKRRICALEGSSVDITCSYSSGRYIMSKFWFRPDHLQVQVVAVRVEPSHIVAQLLCHTRCHPEALLSFEWRRNGETFTAAAEATLEVRLHPGEYVTCAAKSSISPRLYALSRPSVSLSDAAEILEGRPLTLTCSTDVSAKHRWYKKWGPSNNTVLSEDPQLVFRSIRSSDSGEYWCTVENELGKKTSEPVLIDVQYAPRWYSLSVSHSVIKAGQSVTLTCRSGGNPAANYTWYKDGALSPLASGQTLTIKNIRSEHSGNYSCEAHNSRGSRYISMQVSVNGDSQTRRNNIIRLSVAVLFVSLLLVLTLHLRTLRRKTKSPVSTAEPNELIQPAEQLDEGDYENIRTTEL
ncbi:B-cell receptor CD22-like [Dunckerocampus dactyliophorus]|uniref:B-cell receptor CD22-like n=1 Tax=Dunckerocampus dactyliophorus TaxID=161453 RepID=UPI002404DBC5|nr:B-cell receptor CD22-like [Dunckerocampus dactyliophorus]